MAGTTRLELATSAVTGQRSNQLNYVPFNNLQAPQFDRCQLWCLFVVSVTGSKGPQQMQTYECKKLYHSKLKNAHAPVSL